MSGLTIERELARLFGATWLTNDIPEAPMQYVTIPADAPPERDPGVVDVNEDTLADRATVADIRDHLRKRDRNAKPRAGGDYPRDAA